MMNILFAVAVLGVLGAIFGLVLAVASKIFEVKKDPREEAILGLLAGANCGGCGYPGCGGCAAAILAGEAPVTACAPAGAENAAAMGGPVPEWLFRFLLVSKKAIDNAGDAFAGENTGGEHKKIQGGTNK